jgi:hypothetical protein
LESYRIRAAFGIALQGALIRIRHNTRSTLARSVAESGKICGAKRFNSFTRPRGLLRGRGGVRRAPSLYSWLSLRR